MQAASQNDRSVAGSAHKGGYGFHPSYRLHKTDEFSSVFAFRRTIRGDCFVLHYRPSEAGPRLGVVVAKKLARHAVTRNLLKRLSREHFRRVRTTLPPCDLILRLSRPVKGVSRAHLRRDIAALIGRLPR
ncbi:MAG: ribonuclease P protein component [Rhodocyclaceae bacterium]